MHDDRITPNFADEWKTIGLVLDQFNELERDIVDAIAAYVRPHATRKAFLIEYMMHTVVMPSSAKIKLVRAIARESGGPQVTRNYLMTAMSSRNALAHFHTIRGLRSNWNALKARMSDTEDEREYGFYLVVETLEGQDLKLVSKPRAQVIGDALLSIEAARKEVAELRKYLDSMPS
jgi:hypothetical protein